MCVLSNLATAVKANIPEIIDELVTNLEGPASAVGRCRCAEVTLVPLKNITISRISLNYTKGSFGPWV